MSDTPREALAAILNDCRNALMENDRDCDYPLIERIDAALAEAPAVPSRSSDTVFTCPECAWIDSAAPRMHPLYTAQRRRHICESFACLICGQPKAQHHPSCPSKEALATPPQAPQPTSHAIGYIDFAGLIHLKDGHDVHISKEPVAHDDVPVFAIAQQTHVDYWIRQHTLARQAEMDMRRELDAARPLLEQALEALDEGAEFLESWKDLSGGPAYRKAEAAIATWRAHLGETE